jgi:hypothetical protein
MSIMILRSWQPPVLRAETSSALRVDGFRVRIFPFLPSLHLTTNTRAHAVIGSARQAQPALRLAERNRAARADAQGVSCPPHLSSGGFSPSCAPRSTPSLSSTSQTTTRVRLCGPSTSSTPAACTAGPQTRRPTSPSPCPTTRSVVWPRAACVSSVYLLLYGSDESAGERPQSVLLRRAPRVGEPAACTEVRECVQGTTPTRGKGDGHAHTERRTCLKHRSCKNRSRPGLCTL